MFKSVLPRIGLAGLFAMALVSGAAGEPVVKVINFTAEWCPNCKVLNPRLARALEGFDIGAVEFVSIDMTDLRGKGQDRKSQRIEELKAETLKHNVRYLWDWYGGYTGLAIMVAADTGEPISCVAKIMTAEEIAERIAASLDAATHKPPGGRRPGGPDCPAPLRPQP
jgi:thiol-disulfide isomerase/thioredoxin